MHHLAGGRHGDSATVNQLVIASTADLPILVTAGTILKGGKQDRQLGQDLLVAAGATVPVDAFCVERGRWNGVREGQSTDGVFEVPNPEGRMLPGMRVEFSIITSRRSSGTRSFILSSALRTKLSNACSIWTASKQRTRP